MNSLNKEEIAELININSPFLMIDSAEEICPGYSSESTMFLPQDLWFFNCHLKEENVVPGVLLTEAMLQTLILSIYTIQDANKLIPFVVETSCKFYKKVSANEVIKFFAKLTYNRRGFFKGNVQGFVLENLVCYGDFVLVIPQLAPQMK